MSEAKRDYAPLLRRVLGVVALACVLALAGHWAWRQPFLAYPRAVASLMREPAPAALPVPVQGVSVARIADTWGAPRGA
ncbi:MAG TPA: M23 family peptidase, partial [Lysobacter sp.]|nr:M23 family peptidase [Lysobacter sp.]